MLKTIQMFKILLDLVLSPNLTVLSSQQYNVREIAPELTFKVLAEGIREGPDSWQALH